MQTAQFSNKQYLGHVYLNQAATTAASGVAQLGSALYVRPGWVNGFGIALGATGLVVGAVFPSTTQLIATSGAPITAHGTNNGLDTQAYSVNFAGLIPSSGSVQAYLVAASGQIQQNPIALPGPPLGHPDYNPNYVATSSYQTLVDTLILSATTTAPDNAANFEIFRTTLTAGQSTISAWTTSYQFPACNHQDQAVIILTSAGTIPVSYASCAIELGTGASPQALPPAQACAGLNFTYVNAGSGVATLNANGADLVYGTAYNPGGSGVPAVYMSPGDTVKLYGSGGNWFIAGPTQQRVVTYGGNPNTHVAGQSAINGLPPDMVYDAVDGQYWYCYSGGNAATATWLQINFALTQSYVTGYVNSLNLNYGRLVSVGVYPTPGSGTYTVPASATCLVIGVLSPGGPGGNAGPTSAGQMSTAGGGSAGTYAEMYITGLTPGTNIPYFVGAASGGTSTFGAYLSCPSGLPAVSNVAYGGSGLIVGPGAGSPGTAVSGTGGQLIFTQPGAPGTYGIGFGQAGVLSGLGGSTLYGAGGANASGNPGNNATGFGAGGGGGAILGAGFASGGLGGPGFITVNAYTAL